MSESPKLQKQPKVTLPATEAAQPGAGGIPDHDGCVPLAQHNAVVKEANESLDALHAKVEELTAERVKLETGNTELRSQLQLAIARANVPASIRGVARGRPVALHQISAGGATYAPTQEIPESIAKQIEEGVDFVRA